MSKKESAIFNIVAMALLYTTCWLLYYNLIESLSVMEISILSIFSVAGYASSMIGAMLWKAKNGKKTGR